MKRVFIWCLLLSFAAGGIFTFAPMPPGAAGFPHDTENWNGLAGGAACFCGSWSLLSVCNLTSLLYTCIIPLSYTSV